MRTIEPFECTVIGAGRAALALPPSNDPPPPAHLPTTPFWRPVPEA